MSGEIPQDAYITALASDLDQETKRVQGRAIQSVYLGGGTPSLFSPGAIARLLSSVQARCALDADAEITLEANPATADAYPRRRGRLIA